MDKVFIRQLKFPTIVGTLPHEKEAPQTLVLDVAYHINAKAVSLSDALDQTIDYTSLYGAIETFLAEKQFQLLETLADRLADFLIQKFGMAWIQLVLIKPNVFQNAQGVGIVVERTVAS